MKKYDVILITITFFPSLDTSARLMYDLAEGLSDLGLKLLVLAPERAYLDPKIKYSLKETVKGIDIKRISIPKLDKNKSFQKMKLYSKFASGVKKELNKVDTKSIMSLLPPLIVPYESLKVSKIKKIPFILILHDLIPDAWVKRNRTSKKNLLIKILSRQTKYLINESDKIIVLGRDVKEYLEKEYKIEEERIKVVTNWSRKTDITEKIKVDNNSIFKILFAGNLGEAQGLFSVLEVAKEISKIDSSIQFNFVGNGVNKQKMIRYAKNENVNNVKFIDYQSDEKLRVIMNESNALLVSLRNESKGMSVPSKLYYYLTAGKPIIAYVPQGSETHLETEEGKFGIYCEYGREKELIKSIVELKNSNKKGRMGENALKAFNSKYNNEISVKKYYDVIKEYI